MDSLLLTTGVLYFVIFSTTSVPEAGAGTARNIAFKRPVFAPCEYEESEFSILTDGIINPYKALLMSSDCNDRYLMRIKIMIQPTNMIGSVVLFSGACPDCDYMMDNFVVNLTPTNNPSIVMECGQFIGEFAAPGIPMRVNCNIQHIWHELISEVTILPSSTRPSFAHMAAISEIEVYQMEYSTDLGYYGCYSEFDGKTVEVGDRTCKSACFAGGFRFTSLKYDGICLCGSTVPSNLLEDTECPSFCKTEFNIMCGSESTYSVYIARAPHIYVAGCYMSTIPPEAIHKENLTVAFCVKECAKEGKIHAFLQNSSYCFCSSDLSNPPVNFEQCDLKCSGEDRICGGENMTLVYSGCIDDEGETPCQEIYKCPAQNIDEFGMCLDDCQEDWFGNLCLSRDVPNVTTTHVTTKGQATSIGSPQEEKTSGTTKVARPKSTTRKRSSRFDPQNVKPLPGQSDIDMSVFESFDLSPECIQSIIAVIPHLPEVGLVGTCAPAAEEVFDEVDEEDWASKSNVPLKEVGLYFFIAILGFSAFGVFIGYYIWSLPSGRESRLKRLFSRKTLATIFSRSQRF